MKKTLLIAAFSVLLSFGINAQTKPKGVFLHHTEVMDELGMNAEQREKILEIKKITDPQIRDVRKSTTLSEEEKRKELVKVYRNRTKMQNDVLTAEQVEKLKQMRADAKKGN